MDWGILHSYLNLGLLLILGFTVTFSKRWQHAKWVTVYALSNVFGNLVYQFLWKDWYFYLFKNQVIASVLFIALWSLIRKDHGTSKVWLWIVIPIIFSLGFIPGYWDIKVWIPHYLVNFVALLWLPRAYKSRNLLYSILSLTSVVIVISYPIRIFFDDNNMNGLLRAIEMSMSTFASMTLILSAIPAVDRGFRKLITWVGGMMPQRLPLFVYDIQDIYYDCKRKYINRR